MKKGEITENIKKTIIHVSHRTSFFPSQAEDEGTPKEKKKKGTGKVHVQSAYTLPS